MNESTPDRKLKGRIRGILFGGLVLVASLGVTLLIAEGLTRVVFWRGMDFDMEMWKYASKVKMLDENTKSIYGHRPGAEAVLMGVEVRTNSHGLRGEETPVEKPPNTFRIVVIGDSITMGWGVSNSDTYTEQLERLLNEKPAGGMPAGYTYEVLNLGVGNYNTTQEVHRLREVGLQFDPDLILLGYFINDAESVPEPRTGFLIENSYLYAFIFSRLRLFNSGDAGSQTYKEYYRSLYRSDQPGWKQTRESLAALAEISREEEIPILMFIIPELHDLTSNYPFADIHTKLIETASEVGLPVVDLFPVFQGVHPEESLWVSATDAHHNPKAQALIARAVYDALEDGVLKH